MTQAENNSPRSQALVKLLEFTSSNSAKAITYTTAILGMMALLPGAQLPPELAVFASGLGVEAMGSLLDRVAHKDEIPSDELQRQIALVLSESGMDKLLTKESFFHAHSQLLKHQRHLTSTSNEIFEILQRLENKIVPTASGLSYSETRQIAQDVFDANMYRLAGDAQNLARQRANELINTFLEKLLDTNPAAVSRASDPDFQYILFLAQQTFARSGEKELFGVLVNLLVERASASDYGFPRLIQNEALVAVSKLTCQHFNALSLLFLIKDLNRLDAEDLMVSIARFRKDISPLLDKLPDSKMAYHYLVQTGCAASDGYVQNLGTYVRIQSRGLIRNGFTSQEIDFLVSEGKAIHELFELNTAVKQYREAKEFSLLCGTKNNTDVGEYGSRFVYDIKVNLSEVELRQILMAKHLSGQSLEEAVTMYLHLTSGHDKLLSYIEPKMALLQNAWIYLNGLSLTAVGFAVAIANLERITGETYNFMRWIR